METKRDIDRILYNLNEDILNKIMDEILEGMEEDKARTIMYEVIDAQERGWYSTNITYEKAGDHWNTDVSIELDRVLIDVTLDKLGLIKWSINRMPTEGVLEDNKYRTMWSWDRRQKEIGGA